MLYDLIHRFAVSNAMVTTLHSLYFVASQIIMIRKTKNDRSRYSVLLLLVTIISERT